MTPVIVFIVVAIVAMQLLARPRAVRLGISPEVLERTRERNGAREAARRRAAQRDAARESDYCPELSAAKKKNVVLMVAALRRPEHVDDAEVAPALHAFREVLDHVFTQIVEP